MTRQRAAEDNPRQVRVRYARSNFSRVIHVDGAFGGVTNALQIHMAIYNEHRTIADNLLLSEGPAGTVKETAQEEEGQPRFIREIEADLLLTPNAAKSIRDWLTDRLNEFEETIKEI